MIFGKSEFSKNVLTLVTGTAIAQAIPIAISPILTRIYSPEDFGIFALYLSITSVISVIATARYEFAITLPEKEEDAYNLVWLSLSIVVVVSLLLLLIIILFNSEIGILLGNEEINFWLYLAPITVLFSGVYQTFNYWFNRQRMYKSLSKSRVLQTSLSSASNLGIGSLVKSGPSGLICGNIVGQGAAALYFIFNFNKIKSFDVSSINFNEMKSMGKRYINFPKYDALAAFFNISSAQITHIFFNSFFSATISGHYYLVQKIFNAPIALLAGAVQDVFKMEVVTLHIAKGNTRKLFITTLKKLFLLSLVPFVLIFFFAEDIFVIVFGKDWAVAGNYVKIMAPVFFIRFLSFPLSYMLYVVEKQIYNTIGQLILVLTIISVFIIEKKESAEEVVKMLSLVYFMFYTTYLYISFKLTSRGKQSKNGK